MNLIIKFIMCAFALATFAGGAASAQVVEYRDGSSWMRAERGSDPSQLSLRSGTRAYHARVGRHAVLQFTASVNVAAFLRARQLRAVPGPGATDAQRCTNVALSRGLCPVEEIPALNARLRLYRVESVRSAEDGLDVAARLASAPELVSAIPDLLLERQKASDFVVPPNDPRYRGQWYLSRLELERAWQVGAGDRDTTVIVIDDGCDLRHPDLEANMLTGFDALDGDDDASFTPGLRGNEHGTACAGIIAAVGNNEVGIAGACPRCSLRCVRLFDRSHALIPVSSDIAAFDFALRSGAAVVSNSWGFAEPQPVVGPIRSAIQELLEHGRDGRGALVVFAAGNENREIEADEIAAIPGVLNVGAINNFDEAAPFSNYGDSLSLTAPTGTLTTDISGSDGADPSDYTSLFGGTSSACPVVAGVAALLMSTLPERSGAQIRELLLSSARSAPYATPGPDGHDRLYGRGIIAPVAALLAEGIDVPEAPKHATKDAGQAAADGGEDTIKEKHADDGGCSAPGRPSGRPGWLLLLGLALLVRARSRNQYR
ncbi:MAG TPA: S8 family serine peptidase [Polyangiales bacterium]|nr:S8 family serine peptidase [Polyangiales bacterium]